MLATKNQRVPKTFFVSGVARRQRRLPTVEESRESQFAAPRCMVKGRSLGCKSGQRFRDFNDGGEKAPDQAPQIYLTRKPVESYRVAAAV
jgi:hypothetical protein